RDVTVTAERVVTEFANGYLVRTVLDAALAIVRDGGGLTLTDPGVWEVAANAVGAVPQHATYWVGVLPVEVTIVTDNDEPFDGSLLVTAWSSSQVATLYHSLDAEHWTAGASVTINQDAVVSFVAIDPNGVASTVAARRFTKRIPWDDQATGSVIDHFLARRIDVDEFLAYADQFGFFTAFTLYLIDGDWVLDPGRPAAPVPAAPPTPTGVDRPSRITTAAVAPGSEVRYTLDGTPPTDASPVLTGDAVDLPAGDAPVVVVYRITGPDGGVRYRTTPIPGTGDGV
ncbi:MAG TPA: chitobiase/beta-hexosaminidase C-terminal domain-containing protein, partial [Nakamurella sp.]